MWSKSGVMLVAKGSCMTSHFHLGGLRGKCVLKCRNNAGQPGRDSVNRRLDPLAKNRSRQISSSVSKSSLKPNALCKFVQPYCPVP